MERQDLEQIKEVVRDVIKEETRTIVKEEIKENNKKIYQKIEEKGDEVARITSQGFTDVYNHIVEVKDELKKRPTKSELSDWNDKQVAPVARDVDKLKYIHKQEWKVLPDSGTVNRVLENEGLKS